MINPDRHSTVSEDEGAPALSIGTKTALAKTLQFMHGEEPAGQVSDAG